MANQKYHINNFYVLIPLCATLLSILISNNWIRPKLFFMREVDFVKEGYQTIAKEYRQRNS